MEQGHLKLLIFHFYVNALPFLLRIGRLPTPVQGGTGTSLARRYRVWTHESIYLAWLISSSVTVGLYLNEIPRKYEQLFPWISALMQRNGYLALAE